MTVEKRNKLLVGGIIILTFTMIFGPPQIGIIKVKHIIIGVAGGLSILFQILLLSSASKKILNYLLLGLTVIALVLMFAVYQPSDV